MIQIKLSMFKKEQDEILYMNAEMNAYIITIKPVPIPLYLSSYRISPQKSKFVSSANKRLIFFLV